MKASHIIGAVLDTVVKIVAVVVIVMLIYKYALVAYDFGYRVFAEKPVSTPERAKTISISITEDATAMDIGKVLEEKGLINDARLFFVQELLSGHHDELKPGIYELSSDMTPEEMIKVLTAEPAAEEGSGAADAGKSTGTDGQDGTGEDGGKAEDGAEDGGAAGEGQP